MRGNSSISGICLIALDASLMMPTAICGHNPSPFTSRRSPQAALKLLLPQRWRDPGLTCGVESAPHRPRRERLWAGAGLRPRRLSQRPRGRGCGQRLGRFGRGLVRGLARGSSFARLALCSGSGSGVDALLGVQPCGLSQRQKALC